MAASTGRGCLLAEDHPSLEPAQTPPEHQPRHRKRSPEAPELHANVEDVRRRQPIQHGLGVPSGREHLLIQEQALDPHDEVFEGPGGRGRVWLGGVEHSDHLQGLIPCVREECDRQEHLRAHRLQELRGNSPWMLAGPPVHDTSGRGQDGLRVQGDAAQRCDERLVSVQGSAEVPEFGAAGLAAGPLGGLGVPLAKVIGALNELPDAVRSSGHALDQSVQVHVGVPWPRQCPARCVRTVPDDQLVLGQQPLALRQAPKVCLQHRGHVLSAGHLVGGRVDRRGVDVETDVLEEVRVHGRRCRPRIQAARGAEILQQPPGCFCEAKGAGAVVAFQLPERALSYLQVQVAASEPQEQPLVPLVTEQGDGGSSMELFAPVLPHGLEHAKLKLARLGARSHTRHAVGPALLHSLQDLREVLGGGPAQCPVLVVAGRLGSTLCSMAGKTLRVVGAKHLEDGRHVRGGLLVSPQIPQATLVSRRKLPPLPGQGVAHDAAHTELGVVLRADAELVPHLLFHAARLVVRRRLLRQLVQDLLDAARDDGEVFLPGLQVEGRAAAPARRARAEKDMFPQLQGKGVRGLPLSHPSN